METKHKQDICFYSSIVASLDYNYDDTLTLKHDLRITATIQNISREVTNITSLKLTNKQASCSIDFFKGYLSRGSAGYGLASRGDTFSLRIANGESLSLTVMVSDEGLLQNICQTDTLFVVGSDSRAESHLAIDVCDHRFLSWPDYHPARVALLSDKNKIEKKYQVFVSSTYEDLQFERQHVEATLLKSDCIPCGMDLTHAYIDNPELTSRRFIDDCDFFLIIAGYRYGSVDSDGLSFTEKEYIYAESSKKPIIAFVQRSHSGGGLLYDASVESDRMWKFREKLKEGRYYYWLSPTDLGAKIELAVKELMDSNPPGGWVRSPESVVTATLPSHASGKRVFIVHGRNDAARESVARFIEKLDLEAVVLHEQPNKGFTIVEKFEQYSDVGFAVILLTADDQGGIKGTPFKKQSLRTRQNVIFELGFFLGRIGRQHVCALYEPGVEIPSDFTGVAYIELDSYRRWQLDLAKELKAAGIDVNLNSIID